MGDMERAPTPAPSEKVKTGDYEREPYTQPTAGPTMQPSAEPTMEPSAAPSSEPSTDRTSGGDAGDYAELLAIHNRKR